MNNLDWPQLIAKIGLKEANTELDNRFNHIFATLRDLVSACASDAYLSERITALKGQWLPARDQYEQSVLHVASLNGNTRLVRSLIFSGCPINIRDGIDQTALTLALHGGHTPTAKCILDNGASVRDCFFENTVSPLQIAK
jgi:ankyrin repeat protein